MMRTTSRPVLVIGGGISGLLAARRHALAGATVTLVEAERVIGGAVAAVDLAGVEINAGAEAFSVTSGAVEELLSELGIADRVVSPSAGRGSRLVSDAGSLPSPRGGLLGIPGRPLSRDARTVLGVTGSLRAALDRLLPAGFGLEPGVTIGRFVRRRMGRRVAERLVAPVVGGVHSADSETLELTAIQPRLPAAVREHGSLAAAVRALRPSGGSAGTAVRSLTPTMAELPRALERELAEHGGTVRAGERVTVLARDDAGWHATLATGEVLDAACIVLACPPDVARDLLRRPAPEIARAIPEAPSSPVRLVALALDAPALDGAPSGTGALVAPGTAAVRAKALTHGSAKWDHVAQAARALGPHGHIVRLSYGRPGEELPVDDSDREAIGERSTLVDRALADASAILRTPLTREHLLGARVITWDRAMRQARPGHREALDHLDRLLRDRASHPERADRELVDLERTDLELVGSWRDGTGLDAIAGAERRRRASPTDATPHLTQQSPSTEGSAS